MWQGWTGFQLRGVDPPQAKKGSIDGTRKVLTRLTPRAPEVHPPPPSHGLV